MGIRSLQFNIGWPREQLQMTSKKRPGAKRRARGMQTNDQI